MTPSHWGSHLASALDGLRQAEGHAAAPPHLESAVLAAWDREHPPRAVAAARQPAFVPWWQRVAAVAVAGAIAVGLANLGRALHDTTRTSSAAGNSDTLLLVGEPILPGEPVRVVRMRIPTSTLMGLGVRTGTDVAQIDVDVIVGEDGVARAIRVGM